ncbi:MAG TPA: hypothetical protein VIG49_15890 [Acetobacteraceae bacterium]
MNPDIPLSETHTKPPAPGSTGGDTSAGLSLRANPHRRICRVAAHAIGGRTIVFGGGFRLPVTDRHA